MEIALFGHSMVDGSIRIPQKAFYNMGFSEAKALFRQKLARKWGHC